MLGNIIFWIFLTVPYTAVFHSYSYTRLAVYYSQTTAFLKRLALESTF